MSFLLSQEKACRKWQDFVEYNEVLPVPSVEELPSIVCPSTAARDPFCVIVRGFEGVRYPVNIKSKFPDSTVQSQFHVSFLNEENRLFFGNSFISKCFDLYGDWKEKPFPVKDQSLYFTTTINDERCYMVLELVLVIRIEGIAVQKYSLGWALLKVFGKRKTLVDISQVAEYENKPGYQTKPLVTPLYPGTPRAALFHSGDLDLIETLGNATAKTTVSYIVHGCKALNAVNHLFRDNEILHATTSLAGLPGGHLPALTSDSEWAELGARLPHIAFTVDAPQICSPAQFETRALREISRIRAGQWTEDGEHDTVHVESRTLRVGIHNGRAFVAPLKSIPLSKEGGTEDVLEFDGSVHIKCDANIDDDPLMAVVFELEFELKFLRKGNKPPHICTMSMGYTQKIMHAQGMLLDGTRMTFDLSTPTPWSCGDRTVYRLKLDPDETPLQLSVALVKHESIAVARRASVVSQSSLLSERDSEKPPASTDEAQVVGKESADRAENDGESGVAAKVGKPELRIKVEEDDAADEEESAIQIATTTEGLKVPSKSDKFLQISPRHPGRPIDQSIAVPNLNKTSGIQSTRYSQLPALSPRGSIMATAPSVVMAQAADLGVELDDENMGSHLSISVVGFSQCHRVRQLGAISSLCFGFSFYHFPAFLSQRLPLYLTTDSVPDPTAVVSDDHYYQMVFDSDGRGVVYDVEIPPEEQTEFAKYLFKKELRIDIWDGDSLHIIGTARVPLRRYLRQGQAQIEICDELDIIKHSEIEQALVETDLTVLDRTGIHCGKLTIAVSNVGIPVSDTEFMNLDFQRKSSILQLSSNAKIPGRFQKLLDVDNDNFARESITFNASVNQARRVRPQSLLEDPVMKSQLKGIQDSFIPRSQRESDLQVHLAKKKKYSVYAPCPIIRPSMDSSNYLTRKADSLRSDHLVQLKAYRAQRKKEYLSSIVSREIIQLKVIRPSFGELIYFEIAFTNPYDEKYSFVLEVADPAQFPLELGEEYREIMLVIDRYECSLLKQQHGYTTPISERISHKMELDPLETVHLPFKFQSFCAGLEDGDTLSIPMVEGVKVMPTCSPIAERTINLHISNRDGQSISILQLDVQPRRFIIDKSFVFHHWGGEVLKKRLKLPCANRTRVGFRKDDSILKVRCSTGEVAFDFQEIDQTPELLFRYSCGDFPFVARFYFLLFDDKFCSELHGIWQISCISHLRVDLNGVVGANARALLPLPPVSALRTVKCYAPPVTTVRGSACGFVGGEDGLAEIGPGRSPTIEFSYAGSSSGSDKVLVHCLDTDSGALIQTWLVSVSCLYPEISKEFSVPLKVGESVQKKVPYRNGYNYEQAFNFRSSEPEILKILSPSLLIEPGKQGDLILEFAALPEISSESVLVYVSNPKGMIEECLKFEINIS
eukprot:713238_1